MKYLIVAALALLPSVALAQWPGQCAPGQNPNTLGCAPAANAPISTDLVWGWQQGHNPHTVAIQVGQIAMPAAVATAIADGVLASPEAFSGFSGDGAPVFNSSANRFNFLNQILTGNNANQPALFIGFIQNSNGYVPLGYGSGPDLPGLDVSVSSGVAATGQINGIRVQTYVNGGVPITNENQGINVIMHKNGAGSTWGINNANYDTTGLPPGNFAQTNEFDLIGSGPDAATDYYDPYYSNRVNMWFGNQSYPWGAWPGAAAAVSKGAIIYGTPSMSSYADVWIAQNAGTTGAMQPAWPTSGTIVDGTVTWSYGTTFPFEVGRGIWFSSDLGFQQAEWGALISCSCIVQDAGIDFTRLVYDGNHASTAADIRMAANHPIDFSGDHTAAGQNLHTLAYSTFAGPSGGLAYSISGTGAWSIYNDQTMASNGKAELAQTAAATLSGVSTGLPNLGLTVGINHAGFGETDMLYSNGGMFFYSVVGGVPSAALFSMDNVGDITASGTAQAPSFKLATAFTVSTLPACNSSSHGTLAWVTDASSPTYNASLTGGSTTNTLAFCNGSAWTAH